MNISSRASGLISVLSLSAAFVAVLAIAAAAAKEAQPDKNDAKRLDRLIDTMASRNKEPKIVLASGYEVPVFADKYDWSEQDRVSRAVETVIKDTSDELWWRLKKHFHDGRYCLTGNEEAFQEMEAWNFSVGELCRHIATEKLGTPYRRHLMANEGRILFFEPQEVFWLHKKDWAGKPLYLIQIAVCRRAIKEMEKAKTVRPPYKNSETPERDLTAAEKSEFIEKVTKEITRLQRKKRAILPKEIDLPGFECREFDAGLAERAKKLLKERKE